MRNRIEYEEREFQASDIKSVNMRLAASLLSSQLEANTITAIVKTSDTGITRFVRNTPLRYYYRDRQRFLAYVQSVDRVGPTLYQITGTSAIGLLIDRIHTGGIYTGQEAGTVIRQIVGGVPFEIKSSLETVKLYGWLPYGSARDNLAQVLFSIGAAIKTDFDGVLRIEALWDGISGTASRSEIYEGASVKYDGAYSSVSVTEHQYIVGGDSTVLFEGDAIAGDVITFDEPMYDLNAVGFSILVSGANYAKLSAGNGTLTGKKYIHSTREITRVVNAGVPENVKHIENATLVSFVNSNAVADRLEDYYRQTERINCEIVMDTQSPGDILDIYHPYDRVNCDACVESMEITGSNILKAQITALVGYRPRQIVSVEYFDTREIFTKNSTFTVPADVHNIRVVLIGGGQGGQGGANGGAGGAGGQAALSGTSGTNSGTNGTPGNGGNAGAGGSGGKVAIIDIAVEPGQVVTISIGTGGSGGTNGANGNAGGNTTITVGGQTYSSASGASSSLGYTDPITSQVYAKPGSTGSAGAKGGAAGSISSPGSSGAGTGGYPGGAGNYYESFVRDYVAGIYPNGSTYVEWYLLPCGGGGAAYGSSGGNAPGDNHGNTSNSGGRGGNAAAVAAPSMIGGGGNGGNGGGGGGAGGGGFVRMTVTSGSGSRYSATQSGASGGAGGTGSSGSKGANGCAIFYLRGEKESRSGSPLDKNKKLILDRFGRTIVF